MQIISGSLKEERYLQFKDGNDSKIMDIKIVYRL